MNNKHEIIHQLTDEHLNIEIAKDLVTEALTENPKILSYIFECQFNLHALTTLHLMLKELNPLAALISEQFLCKTIKSDSSIVRIYYSYLQKICSVHDLYQAIKNKRVDQMESAQVIIITSHKLQNLSNIALQMLTLYTSQFKDMQVQVYNDVYDYSEVVKEQFLYIIDSYPTFSSSSTISLYQIYNDILVQDGELKEFRRQSCLQQLLEPKKIQVQENLLSDFLSLSSSLMLVSVNTLRPLNIPTKFLPCGGQEQQVMRYYKKFYSVS